MNHPHKDRIPELVEEAIASSENIHHEWDEKNLEWDLNEDSVVFEVGAYRGRWAYQIASRYNPRLYCFEPQVWACDVTRNVLKDFPNAQVFNYALGDFNQRARLGNHDTDGAALGCNKGLTQYVDVRGIHTVLRELEIKHIDLMLMNIEGYEKTLIPHMFERGIFPEILVFQYHDIDERGIAWMDDLFVRNEYQRVWDYGWVLSAWERGGVN